MTAVTGFISKRLLSTFAFGNIVGQGCSTIRFSIGAVQ